MAVTKKILSQYDVKLVTEWKAPKDGEDLRARIPRPNIPKPLHGPGCQPRTIFGAGTWNRMRNACYNLAGMKCEICGAKVGVDIEKRQLHAHEVYDIDYANGTSTFIRCVALCAECVDADTEVLTIDGWKKIPEVTTADKVACWDKDSSVRFENPTNTVVTHPDKAVEITGKGKKLYFSENHRLPLKVASKQSPAYGEIKDILAGEYKASHYYNWLASGYGVGSGHLSAKERVYIAIEADGHMTWDKENIGTRADAMGKRIRKPNSRYGSEDYRYTYHVDLYKSRKIERFKKLLEESGLKYSIVKDNPNGYCEFNVWTDVECKRFANCFDINMPGEKALEFLEELVFWDGTHTGSQVSWFTNKKEETDFVQAIAAQCGCVATVCTINRIGNLRKGEWNTPYERLSYAVNFHSVNNEYCARELKPRAIEWSDPMYCITVPTSYFIARRDGLVFVTGNCHLACIHTGRALTLYKRHNPLYPKEFLLGGAKKAFETIYTYNLQHPDADLRAYTTYLLFLTAPVIFPKSLSKNTALSSTKKTRRRWLTGRSGDL